MDVDEVVLDRAREAWRSGARAALCRVDLESVTLGAALEAACWAAQQDGQELQALLDAWCARSPALQAAHRCLSATAPTHRPSDHEAPTSELRRCPSRAELADAAFGVEWRYFLDRFRRSLVERLNLAKPRANRLAAGLFEMVDNVVSHAGLGDAPGGLVAYAVSEEEFTFAVADLGRGVLASLRENELHASLTSDAEALRSAVIKGASSRPGEQGRGFQDLLRALADMEGTLSFRSGAARLRLDGRGRGNRVASVSNSPTMGGFQMSVVAQPMKSVWSA